MVIRKGNSRASKNLNRVL